MQCMQTEFQLVAGHVALDFANSLDYRYDRERLIDLLPTYERLLAFSRQSGIITREQMRALLVTTGESDARRTLERAIELRENLYSLFLSVVNEKKPSPQVTQRLNRFLASARVVDRLHWQDGRFVRSIGELESTPDGPLWPILSAGIDLLTSPDSRRIHECGEKTCRWLFLDMSRNHSRRWCDMRICGNRAKAQRFYSRVRVAQ
jgi:predicted RNA-binding Zn ribbon-like protein